MHQEQIDPRIKELIDKLEGKIGKDSPYWTITLNFVEREIEWREKFEKATDEINRLKVELKLTQGAAQLTPYGEQLYAQALLREFDKISMKVASGTGENPNTNSMENENKVQRDTLGESRVRTFFNASASSEVDLIKQKTAELIDLVDNLKLPDQRLKAIAMTTYEEAAMWAVKAATA